MRELPTTGPHEGLWVLYALRAAFAGTDSSSMPLTFRVSAGHFACFRVVSRSQISAFPQLSTLSAAGSIPGKLP
jgi:hypothetical protein